MRAPKLAKRAVAIHAISLPVRPGDRHSTFVIRHFPRHTARVETIPTAPPAPRRVRRLAWLLALPAVVLLASWWVIHRATPYIVADLNPLPAADVAILLGTSRTIEHGRYKNPFFERRMDAAAGLYHAGKARHLLLGGDHAHRD